MGSTVVSLQERLSRVTDLWSPQVVARLIDYEVKVVKLQGEFVWHSHDGSDELVRRSPEYPPYDDSLA
jgi:hypothetical protein